MKTSRSTVLVCIWLPIVLLSVAMMLVATEHGLWKEFFVSEFQLVVTAMCLSYFFRNSAKG